MKTNAALIRRRRYLMGQGLYEFAKNIGMSGQGLGNIERGERQARPRTLRKIAQGLGCEVSDLLVDEGKPS
ncbi:helix-turn-helix transcriptional regulator [Streptomyces sp. NPDC005708]|uniref:helix-turn-helix domain-containing protein n=1 Tax=Streptomyces sp. NPDC005708 TaxID=3154564 RepID=UPI0033F96D38